MEKLNLESVSPWVLLAGGVVLILLAFKVSKMLFKLALIIGAVALLAGVVWWKMQAQ